MTLPKATTLVLLLLMLPACASSSLEQIVETRRVERINQANAGRPLTHGAADGLGFSIAETVPTGLTLTDRLETAAKQNNP